MIAPILLTMALSYMLLAAPQPQPRHQSGQLTFNSDSQLPNQVIENMAHRDHVLTQGGKVSFSEVTSEGITHQVVKHSDFSNYAIRFKRTNISISGDQGHENHWAGYLDIGANEDPSDRAHLFFTFHESRRNAAVDPVTLWLSGGPGCSSQVGDLFENGPGKILYNGAGLIYNNNSWNNVSSVIYIDSPSFSGFSYGGPGISSSESTATDLYASLQLFYARFDGLRSLGLHIAGESYAGTYIPYLANHITKENFKYHPPAEAFQVIHLLSIVLGNGMTDPLIQNDELWNYSCNLTTNPTAVFKENGVRTPDTDVACYHMKNSESQCLTKTQACYKNLTDLICKRAASGCLEVNTRPFGMSKVQLNPYVDGRVSACYPQISWIETYLNQPNIKAQLGVPPAITFKTCNETVKVAFGGTGDVSKGAVRFIPTLLDSAVRVLIFAGTEDLICDWMGNLRWVESLPAPYGPALLATQLHPVMFAVNGGIPRVYGQRKTHMGLTFLKVLDAGHMVPYDQAEYSLNFFTMWINNLDF